MAPTQSSGSAATWPAPPGSVALVSVSSPAVEWLIANQLAQNVALDQIMSALRVIEQALVLPPAVLTIFVQDRSPTGMPTNVPDTSFFARVHASDAIGRVTTDPNPFTWTVEPTGAATTGDDPNHTGDTSYVAVSVAAPDASGNQANFTLSVSDGTLSGKSDELVPTPGVPTNLVVEVSPN